MTSAIKAFGSTLTWNLVVVAEVTSLGLPQQKTTAIEVTNESSANAFREFIAGLHDGGEVNVGFNFIPGDTTGQVAMATDFAAGTVRTAVLTMTTAAATFTFSAFLTSFGLSGDLDGQLKGEATMRITGKPVLAITASADATTIAYEDSVGAKTSLPVFAPATYGPYTVTIATASTYIMVTVTDATAAEITAQAQIAGVDGPVWNLTTAVQSGQIIVGAAVTSTKLTITVKDTGKVTKSYIIYVVRP
jgi:hypothetical protein